ncbi:Transamidase GatB domain protein [hydrothermal vent metagenome]|uniref:Transamidase GatB domain protein n=1 Tax=hydrothermal vent metagenome TaxID=652676 RepID=A0A3B0Y440_9ZZZZ
MSLKQQILEDVKTAMRNKDKQLLGTLRLVTAAIKQIEVDKRIDGLDDAQVTDVLVKMVKQRRESLDSYKSAGRDDLADQEQFELDTLQPYLPAALSDDEINAFIQSAVDETGASSMKDMGKVMAILKPKLAGRADMGAVSKQIKASLS